MSTEGNCGDHGPNGAGKTTMMDVVTGKTRPDHGSAWFAQEVDLLALSEPEIAQAGIGRKFQKPTVFESLTVFENLELAIWGDKSFWKDLVARLRRAERQHIDDILDVIGLAGQRAAPAGTLSHGQKQWLEIGMLLMQEPELLLVDEPVAGMTPQETERTAELLRSLAAEHSLIVVEHDMDFVRSIAKRVTVLHEGRVLADGEMDQAELPTRRLSLSGESGLAITLSIILLRQHTCGMSTSWSRRKRTCLMGRNGMVKTRSEGIMGLLPATSAGRVRRPT